jgi:hypothetical protein
VPVPRGQAVRREVVRDAPGQRQDQHRGAERAADLHQCGQRGGRLGDALAGELVHQLLPETLVGPYKTVNLKKTRPTDVISKTVVTRNAVTRKKKRKGKKKRR